MYYLKQLTQNKNAWKLLTISALAFELTALYFQYMMDLAPCIMCIYQRTAVWGIFIAGIIGMLGCHFGIIRLLAIVLWATSAIWGGIIAFEHVEMQSSTMSFLYTCDITPNFPSWAPLHQWLPALFDATGDCGDIKWRFLNFTMPEIMIAIFAVYGLIAILSALSLFTKNYRDTF